MIALFYKNLHVETVYKIFRKADGDLVSLNKIFVVTYRKSIVNVAPGESLFFCFKSLEKALEYYDAQGKFCLEVWKCTGFGPVRPIDYRAPNHAIVAKFSSFWKQYNKCPGDVKNYWVSEKGCEYYGVSKLKLIKKIL